ncbi:MAG: hypothetical protein D6722_12360 [Bacteroidetes bacterium]|nr:MAG: hypothetical protein D6722_12360 [Bacteroidota bacterium]
MFPTEITLPQMMGEFRIRFTALQYGQPKEILYAYKLGDGKWKVSSSPEAQFASLSAGTHRFLVKARTPDGDWTSPSAMKIRIVPPFFRSPLFFLLVSLLSAGVVGFVAYLRLREVRQKEAEKRHYLQRINQLEQQALNAMMNPHFIFNALNSIQHFLHTQDPEAANTYLVHFARLIRLTMDAVQRNQASLSKELERLQLYLALEKLRFGEQLTYRMEVDPEVDLEEISLPSMLVQPFVENAIWHGILPTGRAGEVRIRIREEESGWVRIEIIDTGMGIGQVPQTPSTESSGHISRGITLARDRLRYFHPAATLDIRTWQTATGEVGGTIVTLRLPD